VPEALCRAPAPHDQSEATGGNGEERERPGGARALALHPGGDLAEVVLDVLSAHSAPMMPASCRRALNEASVYIDPRAKFTPRRAPRAVLELGITVKPRDLSPMLGLGVRDHGVSVGR
jgi:hypothetical protein